jgi:metal-dependent amidase/aminoacylase/carboxypeptidase family protein
VLRGTFRCFNSAVQTLVADKIRQHVDAVCAAFSMDVELKFNPENLGYPVTYNSDKETALALQAATAIVGDGSVHTNPTPSMGSEDFAFMLQEKPGCYIWIGNGSSENSCLLHNPHYDFNDDILAVGADYWVKLVELVLAV